MKKLKKTIILVSHVNKASGMKGMDKIVGSGAIAQASTKVIEIKEDDTTDVIQFHLRKSRFTKRPNYYYCMQFKGTKLEPCS
jgi:RecA-family ATPase